MQTLVFDIDDTLVIEEASVREAFIETCRLAENIHGIPAEELYPTAREKARELWRNSPERQYCLDISISSWEGLHCRFEGDVPELQVLRDWAPSYRLNSWNSALISHGIKDTDLAAQLAETFIENRRKRHVLFDDTKACLDKLSDSYRLAIISNGPSDIQRDKINHTGIAEYFTDIIISGETGYGKPDIRIFRLLLSRLNTDPEETWMIGDSLRKDILGAQGAGMKTVWVNRYGKPGDDSIIPDIELANLEQLPISLKNYLP